MRRELIGETLLNQFRVETFLASGGMATIYRVWDTQRMVPLAMKVLHPELAEDPAFIARFQREADSLRLLVHPHIVSFYGLFQEDGISFLLERYIDGPSLDESLRARAGKPLGLGEALVYFKALYTSLGYAHAQGIIHCDVKPGNVLIDQGGHVYLTDFGIARFMDSSATTFSALGTPLYMAPEQIRGERVSPQSDIYALGVLMFELLTGQRPFRGDVGVPDGVGANPSDRIRYQQMYLPPPDPRSINPALPEGVARVILQAMAKEPSARFPSAGAMALALEQAIAARFDSLPDRVALPARGSGEWPTMPQNNQANSADSAHHIDSTHPVGAERASAPATLPGSPPDTRPAGRSYPGGLPGNYGMRRLLLLGGLLALLVICFLTGRQLASAFGLLGLPAAQAPAPTTPATPLPAGSPSPAAGTPNPGASPSPESALANFPVQGEIAVVRYDAGTPGLFLMDAGSGQMRALPGVPNVNQREVSAPQWSPDGSRLAWIGHYDGRPHVVVMDMEEGEPYQIPAGEQYNRLAAPAFLPGGQQLSFWASNNAGSLLVTADAATGERVDEVTLPGYRNMVVWNWAQQRLAFIYQGEGAYKVAVGSSPAGQGQTINPGGEGYAPAWSNDGAMIAFQSDLGRAPGMNEIWIARADGGEARPVMSTPAEAWSRAPTWSPDGRMIAFVSNREASRGADYGELYVVNLDTGETRVMTSTGGTIYDWRPAWRP